MERAFRRLPKLPVVAMPIWMSERKNNRGKIQIMGEITALATAGIRKTHIMYRANLSYEQMHLYLGDLIEKGLVVQDVTSDGVIYRTTGKGRAFLLYYQKIAEFLDEPILGAPIINS